MRISDWIKMTILAAIWGSSFIFMKILAPVIGALPTACLRILISGTVIVSGLKIAGVDLELRKHFKHYLIVGVVNASLPFFLYSFASLHAPSSLSVIMNATTPLFGALFALFWLQEKMTLQKALGFALGSAGVALIAFGKDPGGSARASSSGLMTTLAGIAGLVAAACYAMAGVYIKKFAPGMKPIALAGMSHLLGALVLLPFALGSWIEHPAVPGTLTSGILGSLLALSLVCSALGFILFYHLNECIGPTRTLSVGYLIPVFGILWGHLFLNEAVLPGMIAGTALILSAVAAISGANRQRAGSRRFETADLAPLIRKEIELDAKKAGDSARVIS